MERNNYLEVLFIEDSPEDAELTMRSLQEHNLAIHIKRLEDGQEALDYFFDKNGNSDASGELPKLVLLDLKLPKINGLEVLKLLKANNRYRKLPVVVLTSSREDSDIEKAYELGANSYIVKPVDFLNFSEVIKQLGLYWLVLNTVNKV